MGLFGFGKKKRAKEAEEIAQETAEEAKAAVEDNADEQEFDNTTEASYDYPTEAVSEYEGRGEKYGPWDIEDDHVPDYDSYLSFGSYYLPFMQGIQLRVKVNRNTHNVSGSTVTFKKSSIEMEAFAAPKTMGLWDDVRADLLEANPDAKEVEGVFGMEVMLPVKVSSGKTVMTRIVGVDGPRWMMRAIFSGTAATDPDSLEAHALNKFFSLVVVDRGEEPLAPRDLLPMHPPLTPAERRAAANGDGDAENTPSIDRPDEPTDSDHEVEVKTTLSRGPMFSELR
ncbi:DUF3710 domain-containing protein [Bifidobacterium gallicum]|uniref:DUF3710 domain-containing protein n=1 Tax=Bifidobacterium gallicum DSM 20093 = LMG 11596 TaxID=561180 RepID=D1NT18_9BIFI|nr:DUF3710 domain-containing protein [Bifidobacterium gallicum]EFA23820.1 hypothetical protein BIFGAL_02929 [Bifidobacterium gallicum DSM 20093 = LMG 11596]KFI59179.1 hypothetical protein BGLCM_0769 [Bifidobacterium gallicum DSM 20093 = LMG 11596]